jgi:hypothetical protein
MPLLFKLGRPEETPVPHYKSIWVTKYIRECPTALLESMSGEGENAPNATWDGPGAETRQHSFRRTTYRLE